MTQFASNVLILRKKKNLSQLEFGAKIGIKNTTISNWEKGLAKPDFDILVNISNEYGVDLNTLMVGDLSKMLENPVVKPNVSLNVSPNVSALPKNAPKRHSKQNEMTVLAEPDLGKYEGKSRTIPVLDARAAAGWPATIDGTGFLDQRPTISLPFGWFQSGEYVLIQIEGDSMHPTIYNGDWAFVRRIEQYNDIKDGYVHIVLTRDGIVCKRVLNRPNKGHLALQSDNSAYPTYTVPYDDILSLWKVEMKMSAILRNENLDIIKRLNTMEADIAEMKVKKKG